MIFLKPEYLIFMAIPLLVLFYFIVTGKSRVETIFDEKTLQKLTIDNDSLGRIGRNMMLFAALFSMIVALARPALPKAEIEAASKSIDILVALDISKSMLADDLYPNRLEFAKRKIFELLDKFDEANAAIIAFGNDGFLVSPLTEDKNSLKYLIKNLDTNSLTTDGTNIMIAISKADEFLKKDDKKILIIFSDGGDKEEFSDEIMTAKEHNIYVYIYATATNNGAAITYLGEKIKDKNENIVITKLNPNIPKLALQSGGAYIKGGYKDDSIDQIIKDIKEKFALKDGKSKIIKEYKELFYYPLFSALLFMLFAFSSLPKRSTTFTVGILLFNFWGIDLKAGIFDFIEIEEGFKLYRNENYKEARKHFEKVAASKKDAPSYYDLANSYYKNREYKKALDTYLKAESTDKNIIYKTLFNIGNTYFKLKKYKKALLSYQKAKKIKNEPDLLYNIELTKKYLKKRDSEDKKKTDNKKEEKKKNDTNKKDTNEQKQNSSKNAKTKNTKAQKDEKEQNKRSFFDEKEMKKWEKKLQRSKPKTMPMRLPAKTQKRDKNEKPW